MVLWIIILALLVFDEDVHFDHYLILTLNLELQFGSVSKTQAHGCATIVHSVKLDGNRHAKPFLMLVLLIDQQGYGSFSLRENKEEIFSGTRRKREPIPLLVTLDSGILIITIYSHTGGWGGVGLGGGWGWQTIGLQNALKINKK